MTRKLENDRRIYLRPFFYNVFVYRPANAAWSLIGRNTTCRSVSRLNHDTTLSIWAKEVALSHPNRTLVHIPGSASDNLRS